MSYRMMTFLGKLSKMHTVSWLAMLAIALSFKPETGFAAKSDTQAASPTLTSEIANSGSQPGDLLFFEEPGSATTLTMPPGSSSQARGIGPSGSESEELQLIIPVEAVQRPQATRTEREKEKISRNALILRLRTQMGRENPNEDGIVIPESPGDEAALLGLSKMSRDEIERFLEKKQKFLTGFSRALRKIFLPRKLVNRAVMEINNKFYSSSRLIANSNSQGGTVMLSVSAGLALPSKIIEALKKTKMGRWIPENGGFFYLLGLGMGFSRMADSQGTKRLTFEVFMDVERLRGALTGLCEVSVAGTYGLVYELREGPFSSQKAVTSYGGPTGVFREGPNQFGWAASTGLSFPPAVGAFMVYQDDVRRHYLLRVNRAGLSIPALQEIRMAFSALVENVIRKMGFAPRNSCRRFFAH